MPWLENRHSTRQSLHDKARIALQVIPQVQRVSVPGVNALKAFRRTHFGYFGYRLITMGKKNRAPRNPNLQKVINDNRRAGHANARTNARGSDARQSDDRQATARVQTASQRAREKELAEVAQLLNFNQPVPDKYADALREINQPYRPEIGRFAEHRKDSDWVKIEPYDPANEVVARILGIPYGPLRVARADGRFSHEYGMSPDIFVPKDEYFLDRKPWGAHIEEQKELKLERELNALANAEAKLGIPTDLIRNIGDRWARVEEERSLVDLAKAEAELGIPTDLTRSNEDRWEIVLQASIAAYGIMDVGQPVWEDFDAYWDGGGI